MSNRIEEFYLANRHNEIDDGRAILIQSSRRDGDCPIVRVDFNMVHIPVLWKKGEEYRVFPVALLDKVYQLRKKKKNKSVVVFWEQGIPVDKKVGDALTEG